MSKLLVAVASGLDFPGAVKSVLQGRIKDFAQRNRLPESAVSAVINGSTPHPYRRIRKALARELDVPPDWLDQQLEAQRQRHLDEREAEAAGAPL